MTSPRKFAEKIALHNQKQAEGTAEFEQVMRDVHKAVKVSTLGVQGRARQGDRGRLLAGWLPVASVEAQTWRPSGAAVFGMQGCVYNLSCAGRTSAS